MMISINTSQKGFSLIELMVAMGIASILMAGIYTFYHHQLKTHITQQEMVDMQQDARAAMYMMTREIRMAGYDPQNAGAAIRTANVAEMAFDSDIFGPSSGLSGVPTDPDEDPDGSIDTNERFYYALDSGNLVRGSWDAGNPSSPADLNTVALNIDALNFVYLDSAGNTLNDDGNGNVTTNLEAIRSVQITLVARSGDVVPVLMREHIDRTVYTNQQGRVLLPAQNDNFRRIRLTTAVKVRNLGL